MEELYNRQFGLFGLDLEVQCTVKLRSFQPQVDSPDRVSPGLKSIHLLTYNTLRHGDDVVV